MKVEVSEALSALKNAQNGIYEAITKAYPKGTAISWMHRGKLKQTGTVVSHSKEKFHSVQVCNHKTANTMWIHVERILDDE